MWSPCGFWLYPESILLTRGVVSIFEGIDKKGKKEHSLHWKE